jgi:uncharacterized lipoprotein YehR (DUF1307 family)
MNKKLFVTSILSVVLFTLGNCGSIPRPVLQVAKPEPQTYKLELCGVTVSIPANFRVEKDLQSLSTIHIVKDDIDIVATPTTESDLKKLETSIPTEAKSILGGTEMKVNRIAPSTINGLSALSFFGVYQKAGVTESIDIDVINCATGTGSMMFYTLSPVKTYKRDRDLVVELFKSVKPLPELVKTAPAKKK